MPRKNYTPKNRFMRKSKLDESEFTTIVMLYLEGNSARQAQAEYSEMVQDLPNEPPSTKTFEKLFRRLGRYIFNRLVEPALVWKFAIKTKKLYNNFEEYQSYLDFMAGAIVDFSLDKMSYDDFRILSDSKPVLAVSDALVIELRRLSAARQGIKSDPRADVGLSQLRFITSHTFAKGQSEEEQVNFMLKTVLEWLRDDPLEPDGNPGLNALKFPRTK